MRKKTLNRFEEKASYFEPSASVFVWGLNKKRTEKGVTFSVL